MKSYRTLDKLDLCFLAYVSVSSWVKVQLNNAVSEPRTESANPKARRKRRSSTSDLTPWGFLAKEVSQLTAMQLL